MAQPATSPARRYKAHAVDRGTDTIGPAHLRADWQTIPASTSTGTRTRTTRAPGSGSGPARRGGSSRNGGQRSTARRAARRASSATVGAVTAPVRGASRVLIAEFLAAMLLVALKPTEPIPADGQTGASESVVPQLAATMGVFFMLALVGAASVRGQRFANAFGGLVVVALAFKNYSAVTSAITSVTTYKTPAAPTGAPSATSDTTAAGVSPPASASGAAAETSMTGTPSPAIPGVSSAAALAAQNTGLTGWRGA